MQRLFLLLVLILVLLVASFPHMAQAETIPNADEAVDYLIVVPSQNQVNAVAPLVSWKEHIGFRVKVETMTTIVASQTGDRGERLWRYLHDRYLDWGMHYLLLVGDVDQIPMRMLYPDSGAAYPTDYYYANLSVQDWDLDNDRRWGEFTQDLLKISPDVIVGRIPFNSAADILAIINRTVAFEQDVGGWKRSALLAHGTLDYETVTAKTDTAIVAQQLINSYLTPYGWAATTLYEMGGLSPSTFGPDQPLSQVNFTGSLNRSQFGVVNLLAHGNPSSMAGFTWPVDVDGDGRWDPDPPLSEIGQTWFTDWNQIAANPAQGLLFLDGCSTAAILGADPNFAASPLRSEYLVTTVANNIMVKEYLRNGAPAVIGSTAGSDYVSQWSNTAHGGEQSLAVYFYDHLIGQDARAGDAFFGAMEEYARIHGLARGIRVFNYFGDPSLTIKGVEDRPGGPDTLVKEGSYRAYAADNGDDGVIYVGVLATSIQGSSGAIDLYRSTDHGQSWSRWTWVDELDEAIYDLDVLVGEYQGEAGSDSRVHVAYTTSGGRVMDVRIDRQNPGNRERVQVDQAGIYAKNVALARTPGQTPGPFTAYITWEYELSGRYYVRAARSLNNGATWQSMVHQPDRQMPHLDTGPNDHVYLSLLARTNALDVHILRSTDGGQSWPDDVILTQNDGALMHTSPVVGASTDPALPGVWVVYGYEHQTLRWGSERDLRFAHSVDGGQNWTRDRILSAVPGVDEWLPDLAGYRTAPNRWMNLAYNADPNSPISTPRQVIWRWASSSIPANWNAQRIVNDYPAAAPYADGPVVVYSPGASSNGSGVVYGGGGRTNLYFSAPWLAAAPRVTTAPLPNDDPDNREFRPMGPEFPAGLSRLTAPTATVGSQEGAPRVWQEIGDLADVSAVSRLLPLANGDLLAAATVMAAERNDGRIFVSPDQGATWQSTAPLPGAWSLSAVTARESGEWLAGGVLVEPDSRAGVIYHTTDRGESWHEIWRQPGALVYDLALVNREWVLVATGPAGQIWRSPWGEWKWDAVAELENGDHLYTLLAVNGELILAAGSQGDGGVLRRSTNGGESWQSVPLPAGVGPIHAMAQYGTALFIGGGDGAVGQIFRGSLVSDGWQSLPLPEGGGQRVTSLLATPQGQILAGVDGGSGNGSTQVYLLQADDRWAHYGDGLDLATVVYDLVADQDRLLAATGYRYGNLYQVGLPASGGDFSIYLPRIDLPTR